MRTRKTINHDKYPNQYRHQYHKHPSDDYTIKKQT